MNQEPYGDIELTAKGRRIAASVLSRHTLLKAFLMKLNVPEEQADNDACLMEHILSATTLDRIRDFVEGGGAHAKEKSDKNKETK